jgi:hypothetical protein
MRDDGENGRLGSPTFLPWPAARLAVLRLRPCVRLLGLYLRALGSLALVSAALVSGASVLIRSLVAMLPAPKRDCQVCSAESRTYDTWTDSLPSWQVQGTRQRAKLPVGTTTALALRRSCGAAPQARKDSRQEPHWSGRVEGFSAGWACPQPPSPHPIRPIGPGLPQKAGVSLFVDRHGPKAIRGQDGGELLRRFVARSDCTASHSHQFGGCVAWMQGM